MHKSPDGQVANPSNNRNGAPGHMSTAIPAPKSHTHDSIVMSAEESAVSLNQFPQLKKMSKAFAGHQMNGQTRMAAAASRQRVETQQFVRESSDRSLFANRLAAVQISETVGDLARQDHLQVNNFSTQDMAEPKTPTLVNQKIRESATSNERADTATAVDNRASHATLAYEDQKNKQNFAKNDEKPKNQKNNLQTPNVIDMFSPNEKKEVFGSVSNTKNWTKNAKMRRSFNFKSSSGTFSMESNIVSNNLKYKKSRNGLKQTHNRSTFSPHTTREKNLQHQVSEYGSTPKNHERQMSIKVSSRSRSIPKRSSRNASPPSRTRLGRDLSSRKPSSRTCSRRESLILPDLILKRGPRSASSLSSKNKKECADEEASSSRMRAKDQLEKLQNAIENKRANRMFKEIMAERGYIDPTPDKVEGIFYLNQTSCFSRCCCKDKKNKDPSQANKDSEVKIVIYDRRSLYLFDHETCFRKSIVALTHTNLFEAIIVIAIVLNSFVLAITDYSDRSNENEHNRKLEQISTIFSYIFITEFVLKVIAMGFCMHPRSYIRDRWNWLDFVVVISSIIELSYGSEGASTVRILRVFRVLRPLKTIHAFPQMRRLINALLSSLPNLGNAVLFMFFIFLLFGILGVQQFRGSMYQRCRFTDEPNEDGTWPYDASIDRVCSKDTMGNFQCPENRYCHAPGDAGFKTSEIDDIRNEELIDYGIASFENLFYGLVIVFQFITLEGWAKIMYNLMDSNISWLAVIFSICLVMIGAFFLLNVILAVIVQAIDSVDEVNDKKNAQHNRRIKLSLDRRKLQELKLGIIPRQSLGQQQVENITSMSKSVNQASSPLVDVQLVSQYSLTSRLKVPGLSQVNNLPMVNPLASDTSNSPFDSRSRASESQADNEPPSLPMNQHGLNNHIPLGSLGTNEEGTVNLFSGDTATARLVSDVTPREQKDDFIPRFGKQDSLMNPIGAPEPQPLGPITEHVSQESIHEEEGDKDQNTERVFISNEAPKVIDEKSPEKKKPKIQVSLPLPQQEEPKGQLGILRGPNPAIRRPSVANFRLIRKISSTLMPSEQNCLSCKKLSVPDRANQNCLYKLCYIVCTHFLFTAFITILIILNTVVLSFDQYPINFERKEIAEQINAIVIWFFVAEMIIKLIGLGFKEYARDSFNIFDALIAIISLIDFVIVSIPDIKVEQIEALSVFRGIRLLRVFKLARSWTTFRELLHTIMLTVRQIGTFSILLLIFMLIFTLLGMELFGHRVKLDDLNQVVLDLDDPLTLDALPPRANFDQFYIAFTSIFIVFIGEDWQTVMADHYRAEGNISLIFFMATFVCLNLILLNLFLAILLQNFQVAEEEQRRKDNEQRTFTRLRRTCRRCCRVLACRKRKGVTPGAGSMSDGLTNEQSEITSSQNSSSSSSSLSSDFSRGSSQQEESSARATVKFDKSVQDKLEEALKRNKESPFMTPRLESPQTSNQIEDMLQDNKVQTLPSLPVQLLKHQSMPDPNLQLVMSKESVDATRRAGILPSIHENRIKNITIEESEDSENSLPSESPDLDQKKKSVPVPGTKRRQPLLALESIEEIENQNGKKEDCFFQPQNNRLRVQTLSIGPSKTLARLSKKHTSQQDNKIALSAAERRKAFQMQGRSKSEAQIEFEHSIKKAKTDLLKTSQMKMSIAHLKKIELFSDKSTQYSKHHSPQGRSCGLLGPHNRVRLFCKSIVEMKFYDYVVMFLIGVSTILLILENPLDDKNGEKAQLLAKIDIIMTVLFTIECAINIIVLGFLFNGKSSYLQDSWNILDFIVVLVSLISILSTSLNLEVLKIFRILRVLRPLRMLKRNFGLKIQVVSLLNSIPGIANLLAITALLLMLFGIQGVNFFAGKLFYCSMENIPKQVQEKVISEWDCYDYGGEWISYDSNFDNVANSMVTMFTMMTTEGWNQVMWLAVDATQIHQVPSRNYNPMYIIFFVIFMIFGFLFILNLFVGVILNRFNLEKEKLSHNNELTKIQLQYLEVMKNCYLEQPQKLNKKSGNKCRNFCKDVAGSPTFRVFIFVSIILNSICLSITWYNEPEDLVTIMEWVNIVFTLIYTVEMVIKLFAYKRKYFHDGWNIFDFMIVMFAYTGLLSFHIFNINYSVLTTIVRAFRILRVLKLIHQAKNLQRILNTFLLAIPELMNVGALLLLFLVLFAVLGVFLFSGVKLQDNLEEHANFQHFFVALLTLFRMISGENWQQIMYDCARQRGILFQCEEEQTYEEQQKDGINGCGNPYAYLYFICFMLVVSLIFLNLFIAIILEGQLQATQQQESKVTEATRALFTRTWSKYDPKAKGMIKIEDLPKLIMDLVVDELTYVDRLQLLQNKGQIGFNFSQHKELRVLTKIKREMKLDAQEEVIKNGPKLMRQLEWSFKRYISRMHLPVYDKVQFFNFYDCLAAFSTNVFADTQRLQFEERKIRIGDALKTNTFDQLRLIDRMRQGDKDYERLDVIDQEIFLQAASPDFQTVINRLENKGHGHQAIKIVKLDEMRRLRKRAGQKTKQQLEHGYNDQFVVDSSHIIGVQRIIQWIHERKEIKAQRQARMEERKKNQKASSNSKVQRRRLLFSRQGPGSKSQQFLPITTSRDGEQEVEDESSRMIRNTDNQFKPIALVTPMDTVTPMETPRMQHQPSREFPPSVKYSMSSDSLEQIQEETKQMVRETTEPDDLQSQVIDMGKKEVLSEIVEDGPCIQIQTQSTQTFQDKNAALIPHRKTESVPMRSANILQSSATKSPFVKQKSNLDRTNFTFSKKVTMMSKSPGIGKGTGKSLKKSKTNSKGMKQKQSFTSKVQKARSNEKPVLKNVAQSPYLTSPFQPQTMNDSQALQKAIQMTSSESLSMSLSSDQKKQEDFFFNELCKDQNLNRQKSFNKSDEVSPKRETFSGTDVHQNHMTYEGDGDHDDKDGGIPNPTPTEPSLQPTASEYPEWNKNVLPQAKRKSTKKTKQKKQKIHIDSKGGEAASQSKMESTDNQYVNTLPPLGNKISGLVIKTQTDFGEQNMDNLKLKPNSRSASMRRIPSANRSNQQRSRTIVQKKKTIGSGYQTMATQRQFYDVDTLKSPDEKDPSERKRSNQSKTGYGSKAFNSAMLDANQKVVRKTTNEQEDRKHRILEAYKPSSTLTKKPKTAHGRKRSQAPQR